MKRFIVACAFTAFFILGSCKENNAGEGTMVEAEGIEEGTLATDAAADTTTQIQEDSLIEAPSP